ncbi:hypothetical protein C8R47DRAFT_1151049 [Mycena vitilis]|nr:hypothetical protein C8R47DRAFT_1151049 [Mycena vitilis]
MSSNVGTGATSKSTTRELLRQLQGNVLQGVHHAHVLQALERFREHPKIFYPPMAMPVPICEAKAPPESVAAYLESSFPSLTITPPRYVATQRDFLGDGMRIHHAINVALIDNSLDPLVQFLVVVAAAHNLGHSLRKAFWSYPSKDIAMEAYPYYHQECLPGTVAEEDGFAAEIALFGGIVGVVFEVEQDPELSDAFPFHNLDYNRIAYFCITPPPREKSTEIPTTYKIDKDMIAARMNSSNWFDMFDLKSLVKIDTPSSFQHRLCAVLNSTHLVRPDAEIHASHGETEQKIFQTQSDKAELSPTQQFTRLNRLRCGPLSGPRVASNGTASVRPSVSDSGCRSPIASHW